MSTSVVLPALGESVTEGTVTRWLKNVGDAVAFDDPLDRYAQLAVGDPHVRSMRSLAILATSRSAPSSTLKSICEFCLLMPTRSANRRIAAGV